MNHLHPIFAAALAPFAPKPIASPDEWSIVDQAIRSCSRHCETCTHHRVEVDHHPYGDTWAPMATAECTLGDRPNDSPGDCLAVIAYRQARAEEMETDDPQPTEKTS